MSISFFLMYVFQIFLFPLGGLPAWIQVSRSCLSLLDINPFCFETFFFFYPVGIFPLVWSCPINMEYETSHPIYFFQSTLARTATITNINKKKQTKI